MKKIFGIVAGVILVIIIAFVIFIIVKTNTLVSGVDNEFKKYNTVDLTKVVDGTYKGSYYNLPVGVDLEVMVKDHKIEGIKIINQSNGPKHEGRQTIDDIISKQTNIVDAVSGSTLSSKTIMIAVSQALTAK